MVPYCVGVPLVPTFQHSLILLSLLLVAALFTAICSVLPRKGTEAR